MQSNPSAVFNEHFPSERHALKPFQERVIHNVCNAGSSLAIMPTGGGKSLIYWVATKALNGTALIISPLIALIDEQAQKLRDRGQSVMVIHGGIPADDQMMMLKSFASGKVKPDFIFVSPERIATDGFFEFIVRQRKEDIKLIVVDEIHCVSQWGFNFRPFYKRIPNFLDDVYGKNWPAVLGLTATINPKELDDIKTDFRIPSSLVFKDEVLMRTDVTLRVEKFGSEDVKEDRLWELLQLHAGEKTLVYLYRKYNARGVEDLTAKAKAKGILASEFHGDMTGDERQQIIAQFKNGSIDVVFATNAFGMGIDIPDIRLVVHFMLPESVEQYYQEIGRAGRDKNGALAYMLYTNKNVQVRRDYYINRSFPDTEKVKELFQKITNGKSGLTTLEYFKEDEIQTTLPYFLQAKSVEIKAIGFTDLRIFKDINNTTVQEMLDATKTGMAIPTMAKPAYVKLSPKEFFSVFYTSLFNNDMKLEKAPSKCLVLNADDSELSENQLAAIESDIAEKKKYKNELLDYFVFLLDNYEDSFKLHQEIGRYLGVNKHQLGKIYESESGIWVRSKSEVIIANLLFKSGVTFAYEEHLRYGGGKHIEPDFTINANGQTWYWEHLGMLGDTDYDDRWVEKKLVYRDLKITDLITTRETPHLSTVVIDVIKKHFK